MRKPPPLPGRTPEAEFLSKVGFWFVNSKDAQQHKARLRSFETKGLIARRPHRTTCGETIRAYELTDAGLVRLEEIAGTAAAELAAIHRQYLRDQARKNGLTGA